jgi:serine/threonine protein kinase
LLPILVLLSFLPNKTMSSKLSYDVHAFLGKGTFGSCFLVTCSTDHEKEQRYCLKRVQIQDENIEGIETKNVSRELTALLVNVVPCVNSILHSIFIFSSTPQKRLQEGTADLCLNREFPLSMLVDHFYTKKDKDEINYTKRDKKRRRLSAKNTAVVYTLNLVFPLHGCSLRTHLRNFEVKAFDLFQQLLTGLSFMHEKGIIHRFLPACSFIIPSTS